MKQVRKRKRLISLGRLIRFLAHTYANLVVFTVRSETDKLLATQAEKHKEELREKEELLKNSINTLTTDAETKLNSLKKSFLIANQNTVELSNQYEEAMRGIALMERDFETSVSALDAATLHILHKQQEFLRDMIEHRKQHAEIIKEFRETIKGHKARLHALGNKKKRKKADLTELLQETEK